MTPYKHNATRSLRHNKAHQGALYLSLAALIGLAATRCGSGTNHEDITVYEPTKGVITTIEEVEKDSFRIVGEELIENKGDSKVLVKRLSGTTETLDMEQARSLINPNDTTFNAALATDNDNDYMDNNAEKKDSSSNTNYHHSSTPHYYHSYHRPHSLGNSIWWGAMGYMLGRNMQQPVAPSFYRASPEERHNGTSGGSSSFFRGGHGIAEAMRSTSRSSTISRPSGGRTGFFSRVRGGSWGG
jgi:hypothetical protein